MQSLNFKTMIALLMSVSLTGGCNAAAPEKVEAQTIKLEGEWAAVPVRHADMMLSQCSRDEVTKGDSYFIASEADIARMETALTEKLTAQGYFAKHQEVMQNQLVIDKFIPEENYKAYVVTLQNGWRREYLGIVRNGVRSIYGNYAMRRTPPYPADFDMSLPTGVCDGGPVFFGAEYDLDSGAIGHLAFNGAYG
jgi:hypothetical protein